MPASLVWVETDAGRQEERAQIDAGRTGIDLFVGIAASQPRLQFDVAADRRAILLEGISRKRTGASSLELEPLQIALGASIADLATSTRLRDLAEEMAKLPSSAPGVDERTAGSFRLETQEDADRLLALQLESIDVADEYGTRQERATFAIGLVAIAGSLLGLAGLVGAGRAGSLALGTAASLIVAAVGWGVSGFVF